LFKKLSVKVISVTPFDKNGAIDEAAFRLQLRRLANAGVTVWIAGSGTSEGYSLSAEERDRVLQIGVEELKGKVPVQAMGCEPRIASEMVDFLRAAERAKVDAAQIFSLDIGHGSRPRPSELELYYDTTAGSTDLPVYLSLHHAVGYVMPLDLLERLVARHPNIAGVAYGGTDIPYFADLIRRVGDRIEVFCAGPANALTSIGLGANGFMGGEGNFSPVMVSNVIAAATARDTDALRDAFRTLMAFASVYNLYGGSSARGLKPLMNAYGLPGGALRPPRLAVSNEELKDMIRRIKLIRFPDIDHDTVVV
jgi:dihydrodipicolinate synthase/N-acetylneuraminate lyase